MATINLVLQGKGGVGKSFIASLLAQYFLSRGYPICCFDTDPVNATFSGYKALQVNTVDIMDGDNINTSRFDQLIEALVSLPEGTEAIVDNGSSTFLPLGSYMKENRVAEMLQDNGHTIRTHTIITGGQGGGDTCQGLFSLLENKFKSITIWENPFFGKTDFLNEPFYLENKGKMGAVEAIISLPDRKRETFGADIAKMLSMKLTFDEVLKRTDFTLMQRQRIVITKRELFELLEKAEL